MIKINLNYIFTARGIKKPYSFLTDLGFSHSVAHRFANGKASGIKTYQMELLCRALYCTPNDLIEYTHEGQPLPDDHPLHSLKRDSKDFQSLELIRKLPLEKMEQFREAMDKLMRE